MLHKTYDLDVGIGEVRGLCVIFNIDTFKQETGWEQRRGSAEDVGMYALWAVALPVTIQYCTIVAQ
jgi:hypothetical protein